MSMHSTAGEHVRTAELPVDHPSRLFEPFAITSVCRADLEAQGFDTSGLDDGDMTDIASKLGDAFLNDGFWVALEAIAEALGIPERD